MLALAGFHTCRHHQPVCAKPASYRVELCQVPSAVTLDHDAAEDLVKSRHLRPLCIPGHFGVCVSQKPEPGTWLTCGEVVELTFAVEYKKIIEPAPK
jgi:hypothetical protein